MGNQQQGHDASVAKAARMQRKCQQTTSSRLGFRLCGLKVWQPDLAEYLCRDKYHGRQIRAEMMDDALREFFESAGARRADVTEQVLLRLQRLLKVMIDHLGHRFYSTSLLVLYEGDPSLPANVDLRMIDFAHTCRATSHNCNGVDWGFVFGLCSLIDALERVQKSYHPEWYHESRSSEGFDRLESLVSPRQQPPRRHPLDHDEEMARSEKTLPCPMKKQQRKGSGGRRKGRRHVHLGEAPLDAPYAT